MPFRVLCAVRPWLWSSWWFLCMLLFVQLFALRASSHCKHNMGALSWLNVETLGRGPTPLFDRLVRCSAHGSSFLRLWYSKYVVLTGIGKLKQGKSEEGSLSSDCLILLHLLLAEFLLLFSQVCYVTVTCLLCLQMQVIQSFPKGENKIWRFLQTICSLLNTGSRLGLSLVSSWQCALGFKGHGILVVVQLFMAAWLMSLSLRYCGSHPPPWEAHCKGHTHRSHKIYTFMIPISTGPGSLKGLLSELFSVTRGVWQGLVSPIPYTDDLLMELAGSGVACHWDGLFIGTLGYADDLTLLEPTSSALRMLLWTFWCC